jgi:dTDP-4-amino-4,6-dideoxygalactose transaminase
MTAFISQRGSHDPAAATAATTATAVRVPRPRVPADRPAIPSEGHGRRIRSLRGDVLRLVGEVIDDGVFHHATRTRALTETVARRWGGHPVGTSSCTTALHAALRVLGVGPGDEVIIPALTFISTAFAVAYTGAVPVLADVDPVTRGLDPDAVDAAVTPRTKAVIAVHLHGLMADTARITGIARRHGLAVIEDCAQAAGATTTDTANADADADDEPGRGTVYAGTAGDIGCLSLWVGKNLGGLGDSGLLIARDPEHARQLALITDLGRNGDRYNHSVLGYRGRMSEIDAAVIAHQLDLLPGWIARRRQIANAYREGLAGLPLTMPGDAGTRMHTYYKFPVLAGSAQEADALAVALTAEGIGAEKIYPKPVNEQPALARIPHRVTGTAQARRFTQQHLCLPCYPELTDEEVARVIHAAQESYRRGLPPRPRAAV